jgi:hypothetical protein
MEQIFSNQSQNFLPYEEEMKGKGYKQGMAHQTEFLL